MTTFEFATAGRIIFGQGSVQQLGGVAQAYGARALLVTGGSPERAQPIVALLEAAGVAVTVYSVPHEPTVPMAREAVALARQIDAQLVVGFGGGAALDAGKAIAALTTNPGDPLDYLEVIGRGQALEHPPLPYIAIPTTAGTGAEVTRNAVLASLEHRVKVSLRSPLMLPRVALIDPALAVSVPPSVTASTGMDALTQVIEPFVTPAANPITDAFARDGIVRAGRALRRAYAHGDDLNARADMALAALMGGLALANARLGAVHGFAAPIGGMFDAPHGAICAALLAPVMRANVQALRARDPQHPALVRYAEVARLLTGSAEASPEDGADWVAALAADLAIPPLSAYGIAPAHFDEIAQKAAQASSMKGNPIPLTHKELVSILAAATAL
jgi:alcohol dehydrogenase class IV